MQLSTARRTLLALLLALSAAALAFDLALRSAVDWDAPRSFAPLLHVRRARDLSFLRRPDVPRSVGRRATPPVEPEPAAARGLVLPLDDGDAQLALSLLLNLRGLGRHAAAVPVELAHCGEAVPRALRLAFASFFPLGPVRFLDVCASDAPATLRGSALRLAAVARSGFDELLLLDAHALFFQDPTPLLDDAAFQAAGALFFPAARRSNASSNAGDAGLPPRFDSTLAAWSKRVQHRATASLADMSGSDARQSSSELLAAACERSGASFAVWRADAGVVGSIVARQLDNTSVGPVETEVSLCGALAQFAVPPATVPRRLHASASAVEGGGRPRPLYLTGRRVLDEIVDFESLRLPPLLMCTASSSDLELRPSASDGDECAVISAPAAAASSAAVAALSKRELDRVTRRRQQHRHVVDWTRSVADWSEAKLDQQHDERLADVVQARVAALVASEEQLVYSLDQLAQHSPVARGVVLPLYDKIAVLGVSLVLELRELGLDLPVEIAHCGDLSPEFSRSFSTLLNSHGEASDAGRGVRFYDVCAQAAQERSALFPSRPLFCRDLAECHRKFRGFDIKVLALVLSRFAEVLLLDADTLFFSNPVKLFETTKYRDTGTLFFHDRISGDRFFMAQRLLRDDRQTVFHDYMLDADVARFSAVPTLARPHAQSAAAVPPSADVLPPDVMELPFSPSDFLLASHVWNARAGFQMDSSCVLWSKPRQPRATAVLASFIARNDERAPPSYGDKELFFVACELAETRYAFSDFGIGAVGTHMLDNGPGRSVLCGDMSHNVPEWAPSPGEQSAGHSPLLYINSDNILAFQPDQTTVFYSAPRPADEYPGRFPWQQECPFNVTVVPFSAAERARVYRRQELHSETLTWLAVAVW